MSFSSEDHNIHTNGTEGTWRRAKLILPMQGSVEYQVMICGLVEYWFMICGLVEYWFMICGLVEYCYILKMIELICDIPHSVTASKWFS